MNLISPDTLAHYGAPVTVKASDADMVTIGGYLVRFGAPDDADTAGQWFTKSTFYGPQNGDGQISTVNHQLPLYIGKDIGLRMALEPSRDLILPTMSVKADDLGLWAEIVLDQRDKYQEWAAGLAAKGAWSWSSGSAPHLVRVKMSNGSIWRLGDSAEVPSGEITCWPIIEGALTPCPAEPSEANYVLPVKFFQRGFTVMPDTQLAIPIIDTGIADGSIANAKLAGATTTDANIAATKSQDADTTAQSTTTDTATMQTTTAEPVVIGQAIKSLPQFGVIAVKAEYLGDYLEQYMTQGAISELMNALNRKLWCILYTDDDEPDPAKLAELPAILKEFSDCYIATVMTLLAAKIAEEGTEGEPMTNADGTPMVKSALRGALDYAIKASAVLSKQNADDVLAAIDMHTKGIEALQNVMERHNAKAAKVNDTEDASATKALQQWQQGIEGNMVELKSMLQNALARPMATTIEGAAIPATKAADTPEVMGSASVNQAGTITWSDYRTTYINDK